MHEDVYPSESGRRRFVKGVVGAGALSGVGAGATAALETATYRGTVGGGQTAYVGIKNTRGPAPRGMPIVPLELDDEGYLKGVWPETRERELEDGGTITVAEQELGGVTYSSRWFQYCGVQTAEGVQPEADQDDYLRSVGTTYDWQASIETGTRLHLDHLADYERWDNGIGTPGSGKPAQATWRSRSEGDEDVKTLPVQLVRSTKVAEVIERERERSDGESLASFLEAATVENCVAWLDKCTHFCCTPGFKAYGDSEKFGAGDEVYCQCHQSAYDPFDPVPLTFTALPRQE